MPSFSFRRPLRFSDYVLALFPLMLIAGCALPPARVKVALPAAAAAPLTQTGVASWYGPGFHGKPTASGTIYDQDDLTAAHQTLPLGSRVRVTNLDNGAAIQVMINDRGPFAKGRIIDLSYGAGRALGIIAPGTIPVRLEVLQTPYPIRAIPVSLDYTLQLGSFAQRDKAQQLRDRLSDSYADVVVVPQQTKDAIFYRVQIGTFGNRADAEEQAQRLAGAGFSAIVMEK